MTLIGCILALLPTIFGWWVCRRLLGEQNSWLIAALSLPLSYTVFLSLVNVFLKVTSLGGAVGASLGAMALATGLLVKLGGELPPVRKPELSQPFLIFLVLSTLTVAVFTSAIQSSQVDHDYWLDSAQQGLFRCGEFPPTNPFFPGLPMNGHYGRNLLVASLATFTGAEVLEAQMFSVVLLQLSSFLMLVLGLRELGNSELQSSLAGTFAFLGMGVGGWAGLIDFYFHHSSLANAQLILGIYLLSAVLRRPRIPAAMITGFVLGGSAIVFEIYPAIAGAALITLLACIRLARERSQFPPLNQPLLRAVGVVVLLAGFMALTQGGVFTDLILRYKEGVNLANLPSSLQNQGQRVSLQFPKSEFLQLYLQPYSYWRVSNGYEAFYSLQGLAQIDRSQGAFYASLLNFQSWRLHWLPLYLCPFSLLLLSRARNVSGLLWWLTGLVAYLVPGLVHFGPIYEGEYYRWQFVAGLGFAVALGLAMGRLAETKFEKQTEQQGKIAVVALSVILIYWTVLPGFQTVIRTLFLEGRISQTGLPRAEDWYLKHKEKLGLTSDDLGAARYLAQHAQKGEGFLVSYHSARPFDVISESTLTALTGLRPLGHAFPHEKDFVGTPPFRQSALSRAFWDSLDPAALQVLGVRWLYVRKPDLLKPDRERLASLADCAVVFENKTRLVLKVEPSKIQSRARVIGTTELRLSDYAHSTLMLTQSTGRIPITVTNPTEQPVKLENGYLVHRMVPKDSEQLDTEPYPVVSSLSLDLAPGESKVLELLVATPFLAGQYVLQLGVGDSEGVKTFQETPEVKVLDVKRGLL